MQSPHVDPTGKSISSGSAGSWFMGSWLVLMVLCGRKKARWCGLLVGWWLCVIAHQKAHRLWMGYLLVNQPRRQFDVNWMRWSPAFQTGAVSRSLDFPSHRVARCFGRVVPRVPLTVQQNHTNQPVNPPAWQPGLCRCRSTPSHRAEPLQTRQCPGRSSPICRPETAFAR